MKGSPRSWQLIEPPHGGRFAALEGYRAAAALGVLVFHSAFATGIVRPDVIGGTVMDNLGGFCVAVFFVMSGFLLYRPMCARILDGEPLPSRARFVVRRLVRIYPAYWLALIGWAMVEPALATTRGNSWAIFLLFDPYVPPLPAFSGLSVAWTLSIEVAFYLMLVVIASVIAAASRRYVTLSARLGVQLAALAALAAVGVVFIASAYSAGATVPTYRWIFGYLDWFALGMLLATVSLWVERDRNLPRSIQRLFDHGEWCLVLALACYLSVAASTDGQFALSRTDTTSGVLFRHVVQGVGASLALAPAVLGRVDQPVVRAMRWRPLTMLGVVSYGIYLWHNVVLSWLSQRWQFDGRFTTFLIVTIVTILITLVFAVASHRFVEVPASGLARRSLRRPIRARSRSVRDPAAQAG